MLETFGKRIPSTASDDRTLEPSERTTIADVVASAVPATFKHPVPKGFTTRHGWAGGVLQRPRMGAKGMPGVRADILAGIFTIREVSMMSVSEIHHRYRVSRQQARRIREHVSKYGVDGKTRYLSGWPRSTDDPSANK